jgi:hypothetical protein
MRELRNPSMITVFLIALFITAVVLAPFAPGWITTTRDGFDALARQKERNEENKSTLAASVPSQIAPWLAIQARTMTEATGPLEWNAVSFDDGPCDIANLSQLPAGKYSEAIVQTCGSFNDIQLRYSGSCFRASTCNIPDAAKTEIARAMDLVWIAFADAGFVLSYSQEEQQLFP